MSEFSLIQLTKGKEAIVDKKLFDWLNQYSWCATSSPNGEIFYARTTLFIDDPDLGKKRRKYFPMHRLIMGSPKGMLVDHIDRNGLNNRKENLRICTRSQNGMNRIRNKNGTSKYKGVSWCVQPRCISKWYATIRLNGKDKFLGKFLVEEDAARAYDKAALEIFGEFARLNFPLAQEPQKCP